jgi:hypothetical protein
MAGLYAADGSYNVNVVDGLTFVGRQGANGALNVFQVNGVAVVPYQHVSGAINVFRSTGGEGNQHPSGAWHVSSTGTGGYKHNTNTITVLSGSLT